MSGVPPEHLPNDPNPPGFEAIQGFQNMSLELQGLYRLKNHYDAILSQETKVTKNDYLEKINKVLQGLDIKDVSNKKEVYLFISFYIDGSVEFHGYGGASREPPSEVNIKKDWIWMGPPPM